MSLRDLTWCCTLSIKRTQCRTQCGGSKGLSPNTATIRSLRSTGTISI
jgi:hypothetical protein